MRGNERQVLFLGSGNGEDHRFTAPLERAGFSVTVTTTPADCLTRITGAVDCVVSTHRLDGTDGVAVLRDIRETHPELPVVLVARDGDETVASEAIAAGVTEYIPADGGTPPDLVERVAGTFDPLAESLDGGTDACVAPSTNGRSASVRGDTCREERERALHDAHEIMVDPDLTFDGRVNALLEVVRESVGTEYATLSYVSDDEYVFEAVTTPADADLQAGHTVPLEELPNCKHVIETERTLVIRDVEAEAPELADPTWGIASYLGAPVTVDGDACGTFCFYSTEPRTEAFPDWAVQFVEFLSDWTSREIEREQYLDQLTALDTAFPDLGFLFDAEGRYLDCLTSHSTSDLLYIDTDELLGKTLHEVLPSDTADRLLSTIQEAIETGELQSIEYELDVPAGTRCFEGRSVAVTDGEYGPDTVVFIARDITDRKGRERTLERQHDVLAELHRINTLVRGITQSLQNASTRDEIETAVCEHLTESALYQTAWIGTREQDGGSEMSVVPRSVAGVDESYLEGISNVSGPASTALQSGSVQVVNDTATADAIPDARQAVTLAYGHHALAAIPLTTGETTYGVLVVYAPRGQTFNEAERAVLKDLGRTIALAIQRVHSQRTLTAETTVELQLHVPDATSVFGEATAALDCELTLERHVPIGDGMTNQYLTVREVEPSRLRSHLMDAPSVADCTVVHDTDDTGRQPLVEVSLGDTSQSVINILAQRGASISAAHASDGDIHVTTDVAPESDVRAIIDAVREVAPAVELVGKRLVDHPVTTASALKERVREQLTPKQEAALGTAYARGYYTWPRESTAEELAETMDIASSTLHYHLRHGVETLLTAFFERECESDSSHR